MPRLPAPYRLDLGGAPRQPGRLDDETAPLRGREELRAELAHAPADRAWLLCGGEPTTRPDLPALIQDAALARAPSGSGRGVWLRTDGLALASPPVIAALQRAGLDGGVRIPLHSGRADAHDWLVGLPGAAARATRAIRACARSGLPVEVEVTLTRPTLPYLPETAVLAARLGARSLWIRMLRARGPAAEDLIALAPRLGQVRSYVEEAVLAAEEAGLAVRVEGLPRCVVPGAADNLLPGGAWRR